MISFHNIHSIAKYERKTLFRSWFFRIFSILSLTVLFFMNFGMVSEGGDAQWIFRAIPSAIPYLNLLILNVAQAIIAVFLASDFLKRDKKLDTTEVIYMRSMTNGEYVIGKTLGNIQVFMVLNFAILGMALVYNLLAQNTYVPWDSYIIYLLLISIPTLIYIMGLSFLLMSVIRNQAVTFVIILGYIGITLFLVQGEFYYLFDYMAFNIPMLRSEITGFGNLGVVLAHRGIYLSLGLGFIFMTIFLLKRLPQSESTTIFSLVFGILFLATGGFLAYNHVSRFVRQDRLRAEVISLNNRYAPRTMADADSHTIKLKHTGDRVEAVSQLEVVNNTAQPIDSLIFSLNPGLELTAAQVNGQPVTAIRKVHLVMVPLPAPLAPAAKTSVQLEYAGRINEAVCYLDIDKETRTKKFGDFVINVDKRFAFITPGYVLLSREANWYPTPGVTFSPDKVGWNRLYFTRFNLEVETDTALQAVSQGTITRTAPGRFSFQPENPLTQISLAIGKYEQKKFEADGIEFGVWHLKGHDFFTQSLPGITDTIPKVITDRFRDFQRTYNLRYPFKRLSIVEVPSQFKSFDRTWTLQQENMQPEQVFLQEKGYLLRDVDFRIQIKRDKRWGSRGGESLTDEEYQVRALNNFLGNFTREGGRPNFRQSAGGNFQVTETTNPYFIFAQLYHFCNGIRSEHWPVTNLILESYLKSQSADMRAGFGRDFSGMSEDEMANIALQDKSFEELLSDDQQRQIIDNVIKLKGDVLFTMIQSKAGEMEFSEFLRGFLRQNRFRMVPFSNLDQQIDSLSGIALTPFMDNWFKEKNLPGYLFTPITAVNLKAGDQIKTMVSFSATNPTEVDGIVKLSFRMGGPGGGGPGGRRFMRGGPSPSDNVNKILYLKSRETKNVSYLFDSEPRGLTINTLTSKNIPQTLNQFFGKIEEDRKAQPFDGERVSDIPVSMLQPNEIVVDNEDPEFAITKSDHTSLLQKLVIREEKSTVKYAGLRDWRPPQNWTATTNSGFYGKFVRSAYYIKSGDGTQKATWTLPVSEAGYYDVYTHIYPMSRGGRRDSGETEKGEYHYFITHDDGETEQTLEIQNAQSGWNHLGSFYLSPGKAKVTLTDKSERRVVIADAIKIVKL